MVYRLFVEKKPAFRQEAQAILAIQKAKAAGIELINSAAPGEGMLRLRALESFEKAADGKATKIIVPSEIQGLAGLVSAVKETASD